MPDDLQPEPENIYLNRWLDEISPGETPNEYMECLKNALQEVEVQSLKDLSGDKSKGPAAVTRMAGERPPIYDEKAIVNFNSHLKCLPDYQGGGCEILKTEANNEILNGERVLKYNKI